MFSLSPTDYLPQTPTNAGNFPIATVGTGEIVRVAHLPAYRKHRFCIAACCDVNLEAARAAASEFDVPLATASLDEALERAEIVDLAVHARHRPTLIEQIFASPHKPRAILSQKPFALSLEDATHMVARCEEAGAMLMVNQQARWAPGHRALKLVLESGVLGHVYALTNLIRSFQDVAGSWYVAMEHFNILDHGIHYIDLSRYFSGATPERVQATTTMVPGQNSLSPMIYQINSQYAPQSHLMTCLHFNNISRGLPATGRWEWFADGTLGSAMLSGGLTLTLDGQEPQKWEIEGSWFPDAFAGSMGELIRALSEGREPQCSGRDNLNSIRMALAAVQSSQSGGSVALNTL